MNRTNHRKVCSWSDIKARLDAAWNYVIIETAAASFEAEVLDTVTALLAEHADGIRARQICRETTSGNLLMLIQVEPDHAEAVQRSLLDPRLPPSVTVFFYNHSLEGKTS